MDFTISDIEADIAEFEKRIDVARSKLADLPGRFVSYRGRANRQRQQLANEIEHLKKLIEYAHEGIRLRQKEKNAGGCGRHEDMGSAGPAKASGSARRKSAANNKLDLPCYTRLTLSIRV